MSVMSVSDAYSGASTAQPEKGSAMGKDDFMKLLVAQLQHQDPLNPQDSTQFTAQLAQFSSLEQLQNVNKNLSNFEVYQATANNIQATRFIGKTVTASGNWFDIQGGKAAPIQFDLTKDADSVYVKIYDKTGTYVSDIRAGARDMGEHQIAWDGRSSSGAALPDGAYSFQVMAMDADGAKISTTSYTTGVVTGVDYKSGATKLVINNREIPIASLIRVENDGTPTT